MKKQIGWSAFSFGLYLLQCTYNMSYVMIALPERNFGELLFYIKYVVIIIAIKNAP